MNDDLTRLLDGSDSRVREALLPALSDDPGPSRMRRAALALGLPITAATLSTTTTAAGAVALGVFGKWTVIVGALGLLCGGVVMTQTATKPAVSRGSAPASVAPTSVAPTSVAPEPEPEPIATLAASALPLLELELDQSTEPGPSSTPVPSRVQAARLPAPSASASPADSLALELALLGAARRELAAGNEGEALRALDAYEKAATRQALAAEAMLLRVRALVSSGRQDEASALVARYTRARPNDAYAKKLTELVDGPTP